MPTPRVIYDLVSVTHADGHALRGPDAARAADA